MCITRFAYKCKQKRENRTQYSCATAHSFHYFFILRALCDIILAPPFHQAVSKGHDPANKTIFAVACVKSIITLLVPSRQRIWFYTKSHVIQGWVKPETHTNFKVKSDAKNMHAHCIRTKFYVQFNEPTLLEPNTFDQTSQFTICNL